MIKFISGFLVCLVMVLFSGKYYPIYYKEFFMVDIKESSNAEKDIKDKSEIEKLAKDEPKDELSGSFKYDIDKYGRFKIDLDLNNTNNYSIKDIEVFCALKSVGGTLLDTKNKTLYDVITPFHTQEMKNIDMGYVKDFEYAKIGGCKVIDYKKHKSNGYIESK